jgi:hypothetical protein
LDISLHNEKGYGGFFEQTAGHPGKRGFSGSHAATKSQIA